MTRRRKQAAGSLAAFVILVTCFGMTATTVAAAAPPRAPTVDVQSAGACSEEQIRFDFESGDLQGWRVVEGRFDELVCDRERFHNGGAEYNKQGRYYLSTLERGGGKPDDGMVGVVESPVLRLHGQAVSFLVGGGRHATTCVALYTLEGHEVRRATGANTEVMQRIEWDVGELAGQPVFLRLVDFHRGGWGHVTFDDFSATGTIDEQATFARRRRLAREEMIVIIAPLRAAVNDLTATFGDQYPQGPRYLERLDAIECDLELQAGSRGGHENDGRYDRVRSSEHSSGLMRELLDLRWEALAANPLISRRPILFVARKQYRPDHHNTATLFQTGEINTQSFQGPGALNTVELGSTRAGNRVEILLEVPRGVVRDPDVHFDGSKILVSLRRSIDDDYHIYEVALDRDGTGTGIQQLTFGPGLSDIDPAYLPDGRIVFTSTREPKYCMCNRHIMGNLFRMDADGANIHQIGRSTLFEGHAALLPDGRVLYDRWEYVDRNFGDAQGLWTCNPDGTNHVLYWGNNIKSPGAIIDARIIPGSQRAVAVFSSCHDRPWGALAILDRRRGIDVRDAVLRTWPASAIATVQRGWDRQDYLFDSFVGLDPKYEDPYPLSDKYFLCSRTTGAGGGATGLYLLDLFGNEILLHAGESGMGCFDPMPLAPRPRPAVFPDRVRLDRAKGTFYVSDVYRGTGMEQVERGAVKRLRVVESPEKRFWTDTSWPGQGQEAPAMNWHDFNNKRILGSVPVEPDGSVYFDLPADRFVYFQLLDANGMMIQSMRSGTIVRPGEVQGCVGCHEDRLTSIPATRRGSALRKPPRKLEPWYGPARVFSYTAEVQPVFDKHCVSCHDYGQPAGESLNLAGDRGLAFNVSYNELWRKKLVNVVGAGPAEILPPYAWGSHASRLPQVLREGHQDVELDAESFERIVTWIDINAPYYPTYASAYPGNLYGRSPLDDQRLRRLGELTGVDFFKNAFVSEIQIDLTRPELSPCLMGLTGASGNPAALQEALAIIREGRRKLTRLPRADMPGFELRGRDAAWQAKYLERASQEQAARQAILRGEKIYPYK